MLGHVKRCLVSLPQLSNSCNRIYICNVLQRLYVSNAIRGIPRCRSFSIAVEKTDPSKNDDDPDFEGETDPFLRNEIKKYNLGRRWLARMMGEDAETFTQKDIDEAIEYLLPSHLWAKDARPSMKHPHEIFPKSRESKFDEYGRPYASAFYTGKPKFHDLAFQIWTHLETLNNDVNKLEIKLETTLETKLETEKPVVDTHLGTSSEPRLMQWVKQFQLEQILNEPMTEKNYETIIFRLKKLANHRRANDVQEFLRKFQVPVYTSGKEELKEVDVYDGTARAMGYRKTAIAEVIVREGSGTITVNTRPLLDYFYLPNDREQIMFPLLVVNELNRFDIEAHVIGGGVSGKSGAIRLGLSRAVAALCPQHFDALNNAGLLIRDYRQKERKKPGRKKARRAFQWVKR